MTAALQTIAIRHHGMRRVEADEVATSLGTGHGGIGYLIDEQLDTAQFAGDADSVNWDAAHGYVWRRASEIRERCAANPGARVVYFAGFPEVALAVALGAYIGEEIQIAPFDRHREGKWSWPSEDSRLLLETTGVPADRMLVTGPAVLRIEISATVDDDLVRAHVGETEEVASVQIRPLDADPMIAEHVRSPADLLELRLKVRAALARLVEARPNLTAIHLFIAAPPSACFVTGQELRLRNMPAVETYRFRRSADGVRTTAHALRLRVSGPDAVDMPLSDDERGRAAGLRRTMWEKALREVEAYASGKKHSRPQQTEHWYDRLEPRAELADIRPFPALPPIYEMVPATSTVDADSMESALYGYQRDSATWRVNDRFLLNLEQVFGGDIETACTVVRIFMFHESLHVAHGITKAKVEEVGKFANGLEHVDYTADLYAILHELDRARQTDPSPLEDFDTLKNEIAKLIDLVIRSFWAFEPPAPIERMEIRRLRRYMNWYWQQIRVRMCGSRSQLAAVLARKPIVEFAGLQPSVAGRRYYGSLTRVDESVGLELGIVLDNEELKRVFSSVTVPLHELMAAFKDRDHAAIQQTFRQVFEEIGGGGALPERERAP